jgi:hypothetical protein
MAAMGITSITATAETMDKAAATDSVEAPTKDLIIDELTQRFQFNTNPYCRCYSEAARFS